MYYEVESYNRPLVPGKLAFVGPVARFSAVEDGGEWSDLVVKKEGWGGWLAWMVSFVLIFMVTFLVVNFGSFWQIGSYQWAQWWGCENNSMQELVDKSAYVSGERLPTEESVYEVAETFPDLDLEVVPPDNRLVIPKINKNVPIVEADPELFEEKRWAELEDAINDKLKEGVVHYPYTAKPYERGNMFLTGHSSYYIWDDGRYKDVFALLNKMELGDEFVLFYEGNRYEYKVIEKKEVDPNYVEAMRQGKDYLVTLMTCTPTGTRLRRLLVVGELQE